MALPVGCASHLGIGVEPNSWLKARPAAGWAEPLPGRSDPAVPAAGRLIRGGGLCASVDQSAELTQAERGHRRGFLDPASSQQRQHHRAMLLVAGAAVLQGLERAEAGPITAK